MTDYIGYIEGLAFCSIRPFVALSLVPFANSEAIGIMLRLPLMLLFAALPQYVGWPENALSAIAVEVAIGFTLGLMLGLVFHAIAVTGALIDQQGGYTIGAAYDPNFRDEAALFERLLIWFTALTFFTGPGLRMVYGFFADTWALWPPGALKPDYMRVLRELAETRIAASIVEGIVLAMPLMGIMLLVDIAFGTMSRYAKRLNPFATSRAVKSMVLCFAISFCVPYFFKRIQDIFMASVIVR